MSVVQATLGLGHAENDDRYPMVYLLKIWIIKVGQCESAVDKQEAVIKCMDTNKSWIWV